MYKKTLQTSRNKEHQGECLFEFNGRKYYECLNNREDPPFSLTYCEVLCFCERDGIIPYPEFEGNVCNAPDEISCSECCNWRVD